jgi:hypothetical protein
MAKRSKLSERLRTRGPAAGECNICGDVGPLTEDHTPPKSCLGAKAVEVHRFLTTVGGERPSQGRRFEGGARWRTLCPRCNNTLLGGLYDPALADFCTQVRLAAGSALALPDEIRVEISPQLVLRSVLGHIAAVGIGRYRKGALTEPLRDYMLDVALPLPSILRVYYWLYPHTRHVIIRDAGLMRVGDDDASLRNLSARDATVFWLLKFYPLAFMATIGEAPSNRIALPNFDFYRDSSHEERHVVGVRLRPTVHPGWPEHPTSDAMIMYGDGAYIGVPRSPIFQA